MPPLAPAVAPSRSIARMAGVLLLLLSGLLLLPSEWAIAQEEGGEAVTTTLTYDNVEGERVPIESGRVIIRDADGNIVSEGISDEEGVIRAEVPGPGLYTVTLDPESLPAGVILRDPDRLTTETDVLEGQTGRTIFALISGNVVTEDDTGFSLRQVLQLSVEGLKLGLFLGMGAIGLSLIFGTTGLVNFAHSEM